MVGPYFYSVMYVTLYVALLSIWIIAHNDSIEKGRKVSFIAGISTAIVGTVAEMVFLMETNQPGTHTIQTVAKALEFSVAPLCPIFSASVFSSMRDSRPFLLLLAFHALIQVVGTQFDLFFSVDEMGVYRRGVLYFAYNLVFIGCTLFAFWKLAVFSRVCQNRNVSSLILILVFFTSGTFFRLVNPELRVEWTTVVLTMTLFYLYYVVLHQQLDPLTRLLNKECYDTLVGALDYDSAVVIFDVDDFKNINDTYGHSYGDEVLKVVATCILKIYGQKGTCYRIGGDEFCVIFKKGRLRASSFDDISVEIPEEYMIPEMPALPKMLHMLNYRFDRYIMSFKLKDPHMPEVSVGYAIFDGKVDFKTVFDNADKLMYLKKKRRKELRMLGKTLTVK